MDSEAVIASLEELADKLGIEVRSESMGGEGGLVQLRGKRILFVDSSLDELSRIDIMADALCSEPIDDLYILPEVREILEKARLRKN